MTSPTRFVIATLLAILTTSVALTSLPSAEEAPTIQLYNLDDLLTPIKDFPSVRLGLTHNSTETRPPKDDHLELTDHSLVTLLSKHGTLNYR